jgi:4-alpha-glucanotransferase
MRKMRKSGVLLHITSLPSPYGIGSLGRAAFDFADFLSGAGQAFWQVLPLGPAGKGASPYSSPSALAGNPLLIDLDLLRRKGLLKKDELEAELWGENPALVDFALAERKLIFLRRAYERLKASGDYEKGEGSAKDDWLEDYCLYMALLKAHGGRRWHEWDEGLRFRKPDALAAAKKDLADEIGFWRFAQREFFSQWRSLKEYANSKGVKIIGDVPIYVAYESADVWANPGIFYLDESLERIDVAGCPPDAFSADGQRWGNPLYRWDALKENGYHWWRQRLFAMSEICDAIRIDHFRGFDEYYAIPAGDETAANGSWMPGPGLEFFRAMEKAVGNMAIIAEDLGHYTQSAQLLLERTGYPGMKVLQFAFDSGPDNKYLPHSHVKNCVVYTGTHDNDTTLGWIMALGEKEKSFLRSYLGQGGGDNELLRGCIRMALASVADTAIIPMQDYLELPSSARMNRPSTVGGNWSWRMLPGSADEALAEKMRSLAETYGRAGKEKVL